MPDAVDAVFDLIHGSPRSICCDECYRQYWNDKKGEQETQSHNRNLQFAFFFADRTPKLKDLCGIISQRPSESLN
jgi:hypothetical protein